jgi:nucleoside-diphosphate-sugar epimerase
LQSTAPVLPEKPTLWAAMDVKDAAYSIIKIVNNYTFNGFEVINVGYDETYSINKLIDIYNDIEDIEIEINYSITHPEFKFNLHKLKKLNAMSNSTLSAAIIKLINQ